MGNAMFGGAMIEQNMMLQIANINARNAKITL